MVISESYKTELWRKAIHVFSLQIPIFYGLWLDQHTMLFLLIPAAVISFTIDKMRFVDGKLKTTFDSVFGFMMRPHEVDEKQRNLSGATYVLFAAVLTILFFPKPIAVYAFAMLIIGDACAALVGKSIGKNKVFDLPKTWEGSLAFFISSLIVSLFISDLTWQIKLVGAFTATIIELLPIPSDDNLTIPTLSGAAMFIVSVLL